MLPPLRYTQIVFCMMTEHSAQTTTQATAVKTPNKEFWQNFASNFWEQKSFCTENDVIQPPLTPEQMFEVVVENCLPQPLHRGSTRFFINKKAVPEPECREKGYYPIASDKNFIGYHQRLRTLLGDDDYVFTIDVFHLPDSARSWSYGFLRDLYRHTGANICSGHFFSIFFGDYKSTPFGVHNHDNLYEFEGAFYFPLEGQKQMRIWTPEVAQANPKLIKATDHSEYHDQSHLLTAHQGGLMYWPSDRYHVGSSKNNNLAIPLAIRIGQDQTTLIGRMIEWEMDDKPDYSNRCSWLDRIKVRIKRYRNVLKQGTKKLSLRADTNCTFDPFDLQQSAQHLPEQLARIYDFYASVTCPAILELVISRYWLRTLSSWGLNPKAPKRKFAPLELTDHITIFDNHQLLWRHLDNSNQSLVGCSGNVVTLKDAPKPQLEAMLSRLNTLKDGETIQVEQLLTNCEKNQRHSLLKLLDELQTAAGIQIKR